MSGKQTTHLPSLVYSSPDKQSLVVTVIEIGESTNETELPNVSTPEKLKAIDTEEPGVAINKTLLKVNTP